MDLKTIITLSVSVLLAFVGYGAKYFNDLRLSRRKEKLERINQQLKNLYGPLYALRNASNIAWKDFRSQYRPGRAFFGPHDDVSDLEKEAWRKWMNEVFIPINIKMEEVILKNADLIEESYMPEAFVKFISHVESYKVVQSRWEEGDFSVHSASINFPNEVEKNIIFHFKNLKEKQSKIIGIKPPTKQSK